MQTYKNNVFLACYTLIATLFLILSVSAPGRAGDDSEPGVTVLIYHRFGEDRYPTTNVSAQRFRAQLDYLRENNYRVISLQDLVRSIEHGTPLPDRAVVITIDDGYRSVYDVAWPILKSYGFPFTVFLYVKGVESGSHAYMTWEQVREVEKHGGDFQDHSYSHYRMADRPQGLDDAGYRAWIRDDLLKGARILEKNLGRRAEFLAIPYGEYNGIVLDEAKKLGYAAILSQDPGSVSLETNRYCIPREPILGNEWSTMKHFVEVLNRIDMPIKKMEPQPEELKSALVKRFSAILLHPENYEPDSLGIYVTGLGWSKAVLNGDAIAIENNRQLTSRKTRVMVSGRDRKSGRLAVRTWMIVRPE